MKDLFYALIFIGVLALFTIAGTGVQHNRWQGSIPGSPYFTTNILVEELTNSVTFTISNGSPFITKQ